PPPTTPTYPLSLHDALPIYGQCPALRRGQYGPKVRHLLEGGDGTVSRPHVLRFADHHLCGAAHVKPGESRLHHDSPPRFQHVGTDRKSTRLNSSHRTISYAV